MASTFNDSDIEIWSLPAGQPLATLKGHKVRVRALTITPDARTLISGDDSGVIILWNLQNRSFLGFLFDPKENLDDAVSYNIYDVISGRTVTYTLPCGSPVPPTAVCTCNCVSAYKPPASSGSGGGMYCTCNKICTCIPVPSDRDAKKGFEAADTLSILERLSKLPIKTWNDKSEDASIRHIAPAAQDFAAAFNVGDSDEHIYPVDAQGVAFAAIQALYQKVKEMGIQTQNVQTNLRAQQSENKKLKVKIEKLEQLVKSRRSKRNSGLFNKKEVSL